MFFMIIVNLKLYLPIFQWFLGSNQNNISGRAEQKKGKKVLKVFLRRIYYTSIKTSDLNGSK